ncbi:MAG TPA: hypothetical protein VIO35_03590, partial [Chloroflexota bacterium]
MPTADPFHDLSRLLPLRRLVDELDPSTPPTLRVIWKPEQSSRGFDEPRRLALLPGSFNPPTTAHLALAESVLASGKVDAVCFLLATRTVNKERVEGAALADRLLMLQELAKDRPAAMGAALVNRGLFVDQAQIARAAFPGLRDLWFVVGFDKIVQIFDHRYYADRDAALTELFRLAAFLVAPRGEAGDAELRELLGRPENRSFGSRVLPLPLPAEYREVSSSRLRSSAQAEGPVGDVPPLVARFVETTGAYEPPLIARDGEAVDRYAWRERLLAAAATDAELSRLGPAAFRKLFQRLTRPDAAGRALRD